MVCIVKCLFGADVETKRFSSFPLLLSTNAFHSTPPSPGAQTLSTSFFHRKWDLTPPNIRPHLRGTQGYVFLFQPGTPTYGALNSISHFKSSTKSIWNIITLFTSIIQTNLRVRLFATIHVRSISSPWSQSFYLCQAAELPLHSVCLRCTGTPRDRHPTKNTEARISLSLALFKSYGTSF